MSTLYGRAPGETYMELLKINNNGGGLDATLRSIEDGSGVGSPLTLATNKIAFHGQIWPSTGAVLDKILKVGADNQLVWGDMPAVPEVTSASIVTALGYTPLNKAGDTMTGGLTVPSLTATTGMVLTGTSSSYRTLWFATTGSGNRFNMHVDNSGEFGSNTGSNFKLVSIGDDSTQTVVFDVMRTTKVVDFKLNPTLNGVELASKTYVDGKTPTINATQIGYGSGTNTLTGSSNLTWDNSTTKLTIGSLANGATISAQTSTSFSNGGTLNLTAGSASGGDGGHLNLTAGSSSTNGGGNVVVKAGAGATAAASGSVVLMTNNVVRLNIQHNGSWFMGSSTGTAGQALVSNGSGAAPTWQSIGDFKADGTVAMTGTLTTTGVKSSDSATGTALTINAGAASNATSTGGAVTITGGWGGGGVPGGTTSVGGNVTLQGGGTTWSGAGGNVFIRGGQSGGTTNHGYLVLANGPTERLRILSNGAWSVGSDGTSTGTAGQVLTSNGSGSAPSWQPAATGNFKADGSVSMTGTLITPNIVIGTKAFVNAASYDAVGNTPVVVSSLDKTSYRSVKAMFSINTTGNNAFHVTELLILHDGANVHLIQYGNVSTNGDLGSFDAVINGSSIEIKFTGANVNTNCKVTAYVTALTA